MLLLYPKVESTPETVKKKLPWDVALRQRLGPEDLLTAGTTKRKCNSKKEKKTPKKRKEDENVDDVKKHKFEICKKRKLNNVDYQNMENTKKAKVEGLPRISDHFDLAAETREQKLQPIPSRKRRSTAKNVRPEDVCQSEFTQKSDEATKRMAAVRTTQKQPTKVKEQKSASPVVDKIEFPKESVDGPSSTQMDNDQTSDERSCQGNEALVLNYSEEHLLFECKSSIANCE